MRAPRDFSLTFRSPANRLACFMSAIRRISDQYFLWNGPGSDARALMTLKQVSVGTDLNIVQEGIPDAIPVEACYLGWQDSLRNLASLVEPEINQ
jgi:hypothetical protein